MCDLYTVQVLLVLYHPTLMCNLNTVLVLLVLYHPTLMCNLCRWCWCYFIPCQCVTLTGAAGAILYCQA